MVATARAFDGTPASAREARRFAVATVLDSEWADLVAETEICIAELAANAVLHTRSPYDVAIGEAAGSIRIDVVDRHPELLPISMPHEGEAGALLEDATTGRGLRLVSSIATRWGYTTTSSTKSVWVELGEGARVADAVIVRGHESETFSDAATVQLHGLPVLAAIGSGMQVEGLVRELQLGLYDASVSASERNELLALLDRSAPARLAGRHAAVHAAAHSNERFDMHVTMTPAVMDAFAALTELLVAIPARAPSSYAVPSAAVIDFRAWVQDEVVSQLRGAAPRPCPLPT